MRLENSAEVGDESGVTITPAPKKPKLTHEIAKALEITPPPPVGRQSVPCKEIEAKK